MPLLFILYGYEFHTFTSLLTRAPCVVIVPLSECMLWWADLRQRGSSVALASVAPHGVPQCVGGECVVGGPRAHILLKPFNDSPVGPGNQ